MNPIQPRVTRDKRRSGDLPTSVDSTVVTDHSPANAMLQDFVLRFVTSTWGFETGER
jgi:preprotein translocase subunit Sec63